MKLFVLSLVCSMAVAYPAHAKTKFLRATEITSTSLNAENLGGDELVIEFRQGDSVAFSFAAQGDFLETQEPISGPVFVKKNFWLKVSQAGLAASLDGKLFRALGDLATGAITVGDTPPDHAPATGLNIVLKALTK